MCVCVTIWQWSCNKLMKVSNIPESTTSTLWDFCCFHCFFFFPFCNQFYSSKHWILYCEAVLISNQKVLSGTEQSHHYCTRGHFAYKVSSIRRCRVQCWESIGETSGTAHSGLWKLVTRKEASYFVWDWFLCVPQLKCVLSSAIRSYNVGMMENQEQWQYHDLFEKFWGFHYTREISSVFHSSFYLVILVFQDFHYPPM